VSVRRPLSSRSAGGVSSHRPPSPTPGLVSSAGAVGAVDVAAVEPAGALAGQPEGAVGPPDDRPGPAGWPAGRLSLLNSTTDHICAQDSGLLVAPNPRMQLGCRLPGAKGAGVEGHKHRVKAGGGRLALRWRAAWIARCWTASGFRAGRPRPCCWRLCAATPGRAQLDCGIHAAQLVGQGEGALSLCPLGEEAAGLPAQVALSGRRQTRRVAWSTSCSPVPERQASELSLWPT
jgi:hypothetical protein